MHHGRQKDALHFTHWLGATAELHGIFICLTRASRFACSSLSIRVTFTASPGPTGTNLPVPEIPKIDVIKIGVFEPSRRRVQRGEGC